MNIPSSGLVSFPRTVRSPWLLGVVLLFLAALLPAARADATLTGTVTNAATGATLQGARVVLKGTGQEVVTDSLGGYRFENVPAGSATLSVSYTGLNTKEVAVAVSGSAVVRSDVGLTSDIYKLDKFVVASEREGNAKAITLQRLSDGVKNVVSADAFGGLAGNPADLAVRLPGIEGESVGGDNRYLRIRGLSQNLSTITQDGNRIADAASGGATREFQFQTVGSDSIERIEVTKSPTPDMDGDSIGGAVNLVSKSAFDSSPERRIRGSIGGIWRVSDDRDKARGNASLSYSEVFGGRLGVNVNLAYRPHGSIIDVSTQGFQQLPVGVESPAYQYLLTVQDFNNIRTRSGAGVKLDYKLSDQVRFFVNLQFNKHIEHTDNSQVTWQTAQTIATTDAAGNFTNAGGILPGFTDRETRIRAVPTSTVAIISQSAYKDGKTMTINAGGVHRYPSLNIDYDVYSSKSKAYYAGNNDLTYTARNVGFTITRNDKLFPEVVQTAGADWTKLDSYTDNLYSSARMVGWDGYTGLAANLKKSFQTPVPSYLKAGVRFREQSRDLDNTPYRTVYVGPDGVMGPNPANGGRNDDNLAQFGQMNRPFPDTDLKRYGTVPFPAFQAVGRPNDIDRFIAANPTHFQRQTQNDLQAALQNNQQFVEQIRAAYVMGNVQLGRFSILSGFRFEQTKTDGEGSLQLVTPEERARRAAFVGALTDAEIARRVQEEFGRRVKRKGDYQNVFPGIHMKYNISSNILTRLSYSESIGRPSIGQLIPRTSVNLDNQTVSSSNPSLEPQTARNFDLTAEYYFEPAGMFTAGVFLKEIKKFIYNAPATVIGSGTDNGFGGDYAGYTFSTQANGGFAKVKGLELGYSQQFTFLPGIWKGLGAYANVTRMQSEGNYGTGTAIALAPNPRVAGFNPFVANVGISYIRNPWSLRVSYNYRGSYLTGFNANESRSTYAHARPVVDIKTLYNINRSYSVYLDVVNLLMEPDRQTEFGYGRPQTTHLMRPQVFFGINGRL
ncbi:TonB-dependent receptor [Horticoccus sp. 23ND18S-11]|uniref:TonB-dependent receptor n=1 Tax=Horticoccus sp. 23ND18S-11 TaxID=3391832 RepID=UPI0039C98B5F